MDSWREIKRGREIEREREKERESLCKCLFDREQTSPKVLSTNFIAFN